MRSDLPGFIIFLFGGVIRVFDVRVRAGPIGMLQEQMDIALLVNEDLIFDHSSFL